MYPLFSGVPTVQQLAWQLSTPSALLHGMVAVLVSRSSVHIHQKIARVFSNQPLEMIIQVCICGVTATVFFIQENRNLLGVSPSQAVSHFVRQSHLTQVAIQPFYFQKFLKYTQCLITKEIQLLRRVSRRELFKKLIPNFG